MELQYESITVPWFNDELRILILQLYLMQFHMNS